METDWAFQDVDLTDKVGTGANLQWYDYPNGILSVRNPAGISGENPDGVRRKLAYGGIIPFMWFGNWTFLSLTC